MNRSDTRKNFGSIVQTLGVNRDWLFTGEGEMLQSGQDNGEGEEELPAPVEEPGGAEHMVYIPLVSVRANGGEGEEPFEEEISHYIAYDVNQLRRAGIDPRRSIALPVSGSSMEPTLSPGDAIVVEKYAGEPIRDGVIYVFRRSVYGLVIKRAFWTDEGNLELRSDNPDGPTLSIVPGEENEWKVIGRVTRVEKAL